MNNVRLSQVISPAFYDVHAQVKRGDISEIVLKGGRGSCKSSYASVEMILFLLTHPQCHAVALRKVQGTLRTSVHAQICWAISALGLDKYFTRGVSPMQVKYKPTGQMIYFFGLDDPGKVKSIKVPFGYIGALWLEELDQFDDEESIRNLEQSTLRGGPVSFKIKSFNPPASARNWANEYVLKEREGKLVCHSTYLQTPREWLGESFFADADYLRETNETAYRHEYLGEVVGSGLAVFENVKTDEITSEQIKSFDRIYRGVDWGFYPDPFAYNAMHFDANRKILYIFDEYTARRMGNAATAQALKEKGAHGLITADSAEPKSVADYKACGLQCVAAKKGPGSVEHGMKWLQSLSAIVIDPRRCPDTAKEFLEYEYEQDKDGKPMEGYPDVDNHHIDAVRYAMEQVSTRRVATVESR